MKNRIFGVLVAGTIAGFSGHAQAENTPLERMSDDAHIVLSGKVGEIRSDEFDLLYGAEKITVELDRFGWSGNETTYLAPGESVTVSGYIDDDLFEGREIEAYNIRLNNSYVYHYTSDGYPTYSWNYYPQNRTGMEDGTYVNMKGTVRSVSGDEFVLANANGEMRVDTSDLGYDPFDEDGYQRIEAGDEVYVYGELDDSFFESREIMAEGIVEMRSYTGSSQ